MKHIQNFNQFINESDSLRATKDSYDLFMEELEKHAGTKPGSLKGYVYQDEDEPGVCCFSKRPLDSEFLDKMFYDGYTSRKTIEPFFIRIASGAGAPLDLADILKAADNLGMNTSLIKDIAEKCFK